MQDIILTTEGKAKIEQELIDLKNQRPELSAKIAQAKEMGDLSENAEYHDAKERQGMIEARIREIEEILKQAVMSDGVSSRSVITIGTKFVVKTAAGTEKEYTVVGFNEANPADGKISNESPMGQAFLGKKPGDSVEVEAPKGIMGYKIVKIV